MPLYMVGLTYRETPLGLLERVMLRPGERGPVLVALRDAGCEEAIVLSTCSRTEVYVVGGIDPRRLIAVLATQCGPEPAELHPVARTRTGLAVAEHLFRVTGGLTSRVIGEAEVHGQVRASLREAREHGTAGPVLERLFGMALLCGRRVREETSLGAQGRSLARRAVEVGLATLPGTPDPVVVVVGAGRMARVAVEHLVAAGRRPLVVARDVGRAAGLVPQACVRPIDDLVDVVRGADLMICATSAAHDVVTLEHVRAATSQRSRWPLTLVDLSVPRNVEAAVATLPGVRLVDIEGMDDDASDDPELTAALVAGAEVVASVVRRYADDVGSVAAGPVIEAMRDAVRETCSRELQRVTGSTALTEDEIARIAHAVTGRLLHRPVLAARRAAAAGDRAALESLLALFAGSPTK